MRKRREERIRREESKKNDLNEFAQLSENCIKVASWQ